jgi:hypothetical protein
MHAPRLTAIVIVNSIHGIAKIAFIVNDFAFLKRRQRNILLQP